MTPFEQVLRVAQAQVEAVARGDLDAAVGRIDERGALLAAAPAALADDGPIIQRIMELDRVLSGAIRERMVSIRTEALEGRRGRRALDGYTHQGTNRPRVLDAVG